MIFSRLVPLLKLGIVGALCLQLAGGPHLAFSASAPENPSGGSVSLTMRVVEGVNQWATSCEGQLLSRLESHPRLREGLKRLSFVFPFVPAPGGPLWMTLKDPKAVQWALVDNPLTGLYTVPLGGAVAAWLSAHAQGTPWAWGTLLAPGFWVDVVRKYLSYNVFNLWRSGYANSNEARWKKLSLGVYYAVGTYVTLNAGDILARARTPEEMVYAWSLVAFSVAWPFVHQAASLWVFMPFLQNGFPTLDLLSFVDEIRKQGGSLDSELIRSKLQALKNSDQMWLRFMKFQSETAVAEGSKEDPASGLARAHISQSRYRMAVAMKGVAFLGVSVLILAGYFAGQWSLVGHGPGGENLHRPLQRFMTGLMTW